MTGLGPSGIKFKGRSGLCPEQSITCGMATGAAVNMWNVLTGYDKLDSSPPSTCLWMQAVSGGGTQALNGCSAHSGSTFSIVAKMAEPYHARTVNVCSESWRGGTSG